MAYFVTGATRFIGRYLVEKLLQRGKPVYALVRKTSLKKLDALRTTLGATRRSAAQHSQSLHVWFSHVPGPKVVLPSTPYDAKGLTARDATGTLLAVAGVALL